MGVMPTQLERQWLWNTSRCNCSDLLMLQKAHGLAWPTEMNTGIVGEHDINVIIPAQTTSNRTKILRAWCTSTKITCYLLHSKGKYPNTEDDWINYTIPMWWNKYVEMIFLSIFLYYLKIYLELKMKRGNAPNAAESGKEPWQLYAGSYRFCSEDTHFTLAHSSLSFPTAQHVFEKTQLSL